MASSLTSAISSDNAVIVPGTTPTLTFTIDSELLNSTESIRLDVSQGGGVILQSYDNIIENNKVIHHFSQEDTYRFNTGVIRLQLHGITNDNTAWKSKIVSVTIGETLSYEVVHKNNGGE